MIQPTEDDEIMAELRRNREANWARFGYDWDLVMEDARRCAKDDPIVTAIRREREEHAASLGYDIDVIAEDTKRRAQAVREAVARLPEDPNAIAELLRSERWNGGRGQLGPASR